MQVACNTTVTHQQFGTAAEGDGFGLVNLNSGKDGSTAGGSATMFVDAPNSNLTNLTVSNDSTRAPRHAAEVPGRHGRLEPALTAHRAGPV